MIVQQRRAVRSELARQSDYMRTIEQSPWRQLIDSLANGVLLLDSRGRILYTNAEATRLLQRDASALIDTPLGYPLVEGDAVEIELLGVNGDPVVLELRAVPAMLSGQQGWIASLHDVTGFSETQTLLIQQNTDLQKRNAELFAEAQYDPLTGLMNRRGLKFVTDKMLERNDRRNVSAAVIVVDLDDFKSINDNHGHDTGDRVLVEAADTLRSNLRQGDHLARIGGDEFLVVLQGATETIAFQVAEKLRSAFRRRELRDDRDANISLSASFGVIEVRGDEFRLDSLLAATHDALAASKRMGKDRVTIASPLTGESHEAGPTLEDTGAGFPNDIELYALAQPIVDLRTESTVAFEWFVRPRSDVVDSTETFFRLAKEADKTEDVNARALAVCLREASRLPEASKHHFNISGTSISMAMDVLRLAEMAERSVLELSLADVLGSPSDMIAVSAELASAGIELVLERYVPSRHNLEAILCLRPARVKLATHLLGHCEQAEKSTEVLRRFVAPLENAGFDVIATGVETEKGLAIVRHAGVRFAQGFHLGTPETANYWNRDRTTPEKTA